MLSQVRSQHISDVVLRLNARTVEDLILLDFAAVDKVLRSAHFERTKLTVTLSRTFLGRGALETERALVEELERKLPHILQRGKFVIEITE